MSRAAQPPSRLTPRRVAHTGLMSSGETKIVWEQSDRLLSGATVAVRAVALPEEDQTRAAIAVTLQLDATQCQVSADGTVTATLLIAPDEALGVSGWLRDASVSVRDLPPLFEWEPRAD
jgi:hypothetical protein